MTQARGPHGRALARARHDRWRTKNPDKIRANVNAYTRKRRALVQKLKASPCMDCGGTFDPVCMDFDHRPGTTKLFSIARRTAYSLDALLAEIAKCDLVCANCHRLRTHRLRNHAETCRGGKL